MSNILDYFYEEVDLCTEKKTFKCKFCGLVYHHKNATKMRKHILTKCPKETEASSCNDLTTNNVISTIDMSSVPTSTPRLKTKPPKLKSNINSINAGPVKCRKISNILIFFHEGLDTVTQKVIFKCKFCGLVYQHKNVTKMRKHLLTKCPKGKEDASWSEDIANMINSSIDRRSTTISISKNKSNKTSVSNMDSCTDRTNNKQQDNLTRKLVRAIFASRCPLNIVENKAWLDLFRALNPNFKVPSREMLSTTLFNNEYDTVKEEVDNKIREGSYLTLQIHGWTDLRRAVLNFIINTPLPYYAKFTEIEAEHLTDEYVTNEVLSFIKEYGAEKFVAVISVNAPNMIKIVELVKVELPAIITTICLAHSLNSMVDEFLDCQSIREVIDDIILLIKTITTSPILDEEFMDICKKGSIKKRLILPIKTRLSTFVRCFDNMIELKSCLQLLANSVNLSSSLTQTLAKMSFWDRIQQIRDLIMPFVDIIFDLETVQSNIDVVYPLLHNIEENITDKILTMSVTPEEREFMFTKFTEQRDKFLRPVYLTAYLLNPNYNSELLHDDQCIEICEFINQFCDDMELDEEKTAEVLADLTNYRTKGGIFSKEYIWKTKAKVQPINWWKTVPCNLSEVAIRVLSIPATSVATKRSFIAMQDIQKKRRNKLTFDRVGKLTYMSFNNDLLASSRKLQNCFTEAIETIVEPMDEPQELDFKIEEIEDTYVENEDYFCMKEESYSDLEILMEEFDT